MPASAKTKRPAAKISASKKAVPQKQQAELPIEVIKVKTVEEAALGVIVVTENEPIRVRRSGATTEDDKPQESTGIPESNGKWRSTGAGQRVPT